MKRQVPKLAKDIQKYRHKLKYAKNKLNITSHRDVAKLIPNFYIWYSVQVRDYALPDDTQVPLLEGVAFTKTKRGEEGVKIVTLSTDGELQIKDDRRDET